MVGLAILIEGSAVLLFDRRGAIREDFTEKGAGIKGQRTVRLSEVQQATRNVVDAGGSGGP